AHAGPQRADGSGLDDRTVGDRVTERDSKFDHVGAALDPSVEIGLALRDARIADDQESSQRAFAAVEAALEHGGVAGHGLTPSRRCAEAMSLSPRPDRLTSRIGSSPRSSASF